MPKSAICIVVAADWRDERIKELETQLAVSNARIAEQDARAGEREVLVVEQATRIAELEQQIAALKKLVDELMEKLGRNSRNSTLPPSSDAVREAWASTFGSILVFSACGSRTDIADFLPDALGPHLPGDAAATDAPPVGAACAVSCGIGEVCLHEYYTHDPPPLPDGGVCTHGTQRYNRCWNVTDECGPVPTGCVLVPSCSCPPLGRPDWPEGCECTDDGSFDCYSIGI